MTIIGDEVVGVAGHGAVNELVVVLVGVDEAEALGGLDGYDEGTHRKHRPEPGTGEGRRPTC